MIRALVTGGSGDIGAAICRRLALSGMHVIIHANKSAERAALVQSEIDSAGGSSETTCFDVTDSDQTTAALEGLLAGGAILVTMPPWRACHIRSGSGSSMFP